MTDTAIGLPAGRAASAGFRLLADDRLARLAAAGDSRAFTAVFQRHHQALYRYCMSIVRHSEDASDALQNTMIKALRGLGGKRDDVPLRPWLFRIAHNECVSLLRGRRTHEPLTERGAPLIADVADDAESRARLEQLVADLNSLPERQRGALVMRELSGLEYTEIAAVFEITTGAAKKTVFDARVGLHEQAEGRAMDCEHIRRALSEGDRRRTRARAVRAHLRGCEGCQGFAELIAGRPRQLAALTPPLPSASAAALLSGLLGGGGGQGGGGLLAGASAGAAPAMKVALGAPSIVGALVALSAGAGSVGIANGMTDSKGARPQASLKAVPSQVTIASMASPSAGGRLVRPGVDGGGRAPVAIGRPTPAGERSGSDPTAGPDAGHGSSRAPVKSTHKTSAPPPPRRAALSRVRPRPVIEDVRQTVTEVRSAPVRSVARVVEAQVERLPLPPPAPRLLKPRVLPAADR